MTQDTQTGITPDPFNPAALRLDPSYAETVGVRKHLMTVPVRKPNKHEFVRVHTDLAYRLTPAAIIELKEDREVYLLAPSMVHQLAGEFSAATLFTTINRQGVLFLWPVKLPGADGKDNEWYRSSREAAEKAMTAWVPSRRTSPLGPTSSSRPQVTSRNRSGRICRSRRSSGSPSATNTSTVPITP